MGYGRDTIRRSLRVRRGLSFAEFVGCLFALGGGIALGSFYLGVDVKTLFVGILEQADLVEPGFLGTGATAEETIAVIPENVGKAGAEPVAKSIHVPPSGSGMQLPTEKERQATTELYWQGLTACIREEVSHRSSASGDPKTARLFDYWTRRHKGHQKAVEAIKAIDRLGVDERLLRHGNQVLAWNQAGAQLYGQAADRVTGSSSEVQTWQSDATQHHMEERLVRDKHFSVASYLDHAFQDAAPFKPAF